MAIQVVGTYRREYLKKHGTPPNTLGLELTLDTDLTKRATDKVNRRAKDRAAAQYSLNLNEPNQPRTT